MGKIYKIVTFYQYFGHICNLGGGGKIILGGAKNMNTPRPGGHPQAAADA